MKNMKQMAFKDESAFIKRMTNCANKVQKTHSFYLCEFLSPDQQATLTSIINKYPDLSCTFNGGIEHAENMRAIIYHHTYSYDVADFEITVYEVKYPYAFIDLRHKDVMGSVLSLGIERNRVGDFIIQNQHIFFACDMKIAHFIELNLEQINRAKIKLEKTTQTVLRHQNFETMQVGVTSLRVDLIVAKMFSLSRKQALDLFMIKSVKINFKVVDNPSHMCHNNDVISVAKYGRFKLETTETITKKGNLRVNLHKYL